MRICTSCGRRRAAKSFRSGHAACRDCELDTTQRWRKENPTRYKQTLERQKARRRAAKKLIARHRDEFERLVKAEMRK